MATMHGGWSSKWEARRRRAQRGVISIPPAAKHSPQPLVTPAATGWGYADAGKRDLRIDLLRGFAVFAMVVDHVGGASWLYNISGGNRFFVSAAEGFVFLSGLTVGIVYGGLAIAKGLRPAVFKLLQRAWLLYVLAVWLTLGFALTSTILDDPVGLPFANSPARFIFEVITLQRTFYLSDVLLVYLFCMLLATVALALIRRGLWWAVGLVSIGLWGALQVQPRFASFPWPIADNPVFLFAAWQLPFFVGMIIGYHRDWLREHVLARVPASPLRDGYVLPLGALVGVLVWLSGTNATIFARFAPGGNTAAVLDDWFLKSHLPLPRLLAAGVIFAFAWAFVTRCWRPVRAITGPFLLTLGQGALYAYAAHLFLAALVHFAASEIADTPGGAYPKLHPGINTALQVTALLVLWALTRTRFLQGVVAPLGNAPFVRVERNRRWQLAFRPNEPLLAIVVVALVTLAYTLPLSSSARAAALKSSSSGAASRQVGGAAAGSANTVQAVSTVTAPRQIAGAASGSSNTVAAVSTVTAPRQIGSTTGNASAAAPASTVTAPRNVAGAANGSGTTNSTTTGTTGNTTGTASGAAPSAVASAAPSASASATPAKAPGYLLDQSFYSAALGRTMPYGIYLPPGYDQETTRYPVLYMLHGSGGHYSEWVAYGLADTAERLIQSGRIVPMIIIFPQGDESYFVNHPAGDDERWGDYIVDDLVSHVDGTYRTIAERSGRAIGGLSMGGYGALSLGFAHPELFTAIGAHSPSLRTQPEASDFMGDPEQYAEIDPMAMAQYLDPNLAPKIWIDTGTTDPWASRATFLKDELRARGILPEYSETTGGHEGTFWQMNAGRYLRFYAGAFAASEK